MLDAGAALDPDGYGTGAAVADVDGDGVLELLVSRGEKAAQPLGVFKARAAHPNWLRVRPLTRFGAPARGAVVRAEYAGRVRVKGICGGSGYLCQMEPVAHFGLGDATAAERVTVTWPDGAGVVLLNPGGNRVLTVPYPRG
ncbi:CRTAC1 family protein [Gemmata obscuriglobus]|nr:CRTAC1 family protein [Gemmata obscuriglobus]VTS04008.1 FG-GAP repeat/ASPIC/UnbV domain protein OS=Synechococcus sp. (strain JA-2-3B'a(2-13)) GN=CYB_2800 PE=4 SV=1: FG-GAP: UnbV_ASPIC [Gemmata obscuriglobus UQM 2246]